MTGEAFFALMFGACHQMRTGYFFLLEHIPILGIPYYLVQYSFEIPVPGRAAATWERFLVTRGGTSVLKLAVMSNRIVSLTLERTGETFSLQNIGTH